MIEVKPFVSADLRELSLQPAQEWMQPVLEKPEYAAAIEGAESYSIFIDGHIVAIGFLAMIWEGRAQLSALVSTMVGPRQMIALHREVKRRIDACRVRRIEATVDDLFMPGHRWLSMLGFKCETPAGMPGHLPDGRRSFLYARVR